MASSFQQEFQDCLAAHAGIVRKVAASYAWDAADRADLIQDISAALWQAWPRYDTERPLATWMYRIALNVAIGWVRGETARRRRQVAFDPDLHAPVADEHDTDAAARESALQHALSVLDPLSRALLLMHLDERSHRQIAEVLGISESNVATRFSRIKQRLRTLLQSHHDS